MAIDRTLWHLIEKAALKLTDARFTSMREWRWAVGTDKEAEKRARYEALRWAAGLVDEIARAAEEGE